MADPGLAMLINSGGSSSQPISFLEAGAAVGEQWQPLITLATDSQSHEPLESNADRWPILLLNTAGALFFRTLTATSVGVAALSKVPTFVQTLAATAVGVAAMTRVATFSKTLAAIAIGVATLARKQFVTMAATAIGVATMSNVLVIVKTLASVAVGIASLTEVFIAGAGSRVRRLYSRMRGRRGRGR